jgi:hypothetical protein
MERLTWQPVIHMGFAPLDSREHGLAEGRVRGPRTVVVPEAGTGSARIVCQGMPWYREWGVGKSGGPRQALLAQAADPQAWPDTAEAEAEARGARKGMRGQGDPAQHGPPGARGRGHSSSAPSPPLLPLPPTVSAPGQSDSGSPTCQTLTGIVMGCRA